MLKRRYDEDNELCILSDTHLKRLRIDENFFNNKIIGGVKIISLSHESLFCRIQTLFTIYQDEDNFIGPIGMEKLCIDLGVNQDHFVIMVLYFYLNVSRLGYITRNEFVTGLAKLNIDSIETLRSNLFYFSKEATTRLDEIYDFAFRASKVTPAQKVIKIDVATHLMKILIPDKTHTFPFLEFIRNSNYTVINADQWKMFFLFNKTFGMELEEYSDDGAWPVMIDEYVDYLRKKREDAMDIK